MDQLADNIKTRSLSEALEVLTDQVLEISSLTIKDLLEQPNLREKLLHLSEGIQSSAKHLCGILGKKLNTLEPSNHEFISLKELILVAEDASKFSLDLALDADNLEEFQDKIAVLLEVVLKLIILWDRELITDLQLSIVSLRKTLISIRKTQFLHEIISYYKEFIHKFLEFTNQLSRRVKDLVDKKIQNEFWIHLSCIRKLATSFAQVIKNVARFPLSKHSKISKEFVVKELLSLLDEVEELLCMSEPQQAQKAQHGGSFLSAIDEVLEQLERSHFDDDEMEPRLHLILQHAMTVSKFSIEEDRQQITRHSQRVLNEYKSLQNVLQNLEHSPGDIPLAVDILRDFLELLEQSVNHSLLRMMVENLSAGTEHVRRLIHRCPANMGIPVSERSNSDLAFEVEEFDNVMERVLQTCFFALSSTGDMLKVQVIRCALKLLESLETEMVPAIYSCYLSPDDRAADCHLQFLWHSFRQQFQLLQTSLDSIADPVAFCHVAEKVLSDSVGLLRKDLYIQDVELLERRCRPMLSIASRCLDLLEQQDWGKLLADKIFLKEIRLGVREFKGAIQLTVGNISDLSSHRSMLKRAELVLKYLMKSIDIMKQMQDSQEFPSLTETLRNTVLAAPSFIAFPENVSDLPFDSSQIQMQNTLAHHRMCRSLIGRTPKRKIQRSQDNGGIEGNMEELSRFIDTTQPWRTKTLLVTEDVFSFESASEATIQNGQSETFDLTDLLEKLSTLDDMFSNVEGNEESKFKTPVATTQPLCPAQSSATINTPNRLRDLQIVSERLALLRGRHNPV